MYVAVLLVMPAVAVAVAALPQRLDPARVLARATRNDARRPTTWRIVPLILGMLMSAWAGTSTSTNEDPTSSQVQLFVVGACLTGAGLVLVAPVFVRLTADVMTRTARGPATLMTARRLQAQPASITRVVAALMIGLFLVTGARAVLGSFQATPQYVVAERAMNAPYLVALKPDTKTDPTRLQGDVETLGGVRDATTLPVLAAQCGPTPDYVCDAIVATCAQLRSYLNPATTRCRDNEVQWANRPSDQAPAGTFTLRAQANESPTGDPVVVPSPSPTVLSTQADSIEGSLADLPFALRIPPSTPGIDALTSTTAHTILVSAEAGPTLVDNLAATDFGQGGFGYQAPSFDDYDFVAQVSSIIWTLAAVILSIGLLTFAVAAIDRTLTRQREVTGLLLLGVPPRVIRRAQLLEAFIPVSAGTLLAIAAGAFAGASYLSTIGDNQFIPWNPTLVLAVVGLAASTAVAGLTVLGTPTRINANRIRTE